MRYMHCSYQELQQMPDDYIEVLVEMARKEAAEQRAAARERRSAAGRRR